MQTGSCALKNAPLKLLTTESGRLGAGFAPRDLGVQGRVVDHQALHQGHGPILPLGPQQIQHVACKWRRIQCRAVVNRRIGAKNLYHGI